MLLRRIRTIEELKVCQGCSERFCDKVSKVIPAEFGGEGGGGDVGAGGRMAQKVGGEDEDGDIEDDF